ncbi:exopolysaccharide biosynthesis polyprenyl glycosylphosphotransferase [Bacillus cereus]|uniref:exopolysaccharide biosynthesis polyprenyl glycosylphosphotransferase n=1 Tax=Bacillus cereus TaxID=1396 RepID=UPI0009C9677F|nr:MULTISPECIES: exopolysaccharide biosynthesis polyprenyl glycosylphosphotransferase [Bacillus cereus group]MCB5897710.1 exopolysaccharide biosynthesis polyprenyl glycosylphosphotransferase [Bacillus cereus]MDA2530937.1 exopolysaccharide biosynthesis polyprenyl glycosylphosphotransferase [Bacillus cereus]MDZ4630841.1 exopolysaccharide biosynthesis polyprenyl glycosylphosphotransferase [Bacillus cereus]MEB2586352.1 exopolysaccharide biosynthesis polyprenyl glycosylphosphotransferase [Bacillus c
MIEGVYIAEKDNYILLKRIVESIMAICGIFILSPVLIIISILIKIDSKGPIIYSQERLGVNGKRFRVLKFRSMVVDAEKGGPQWATKDDNRITKFGHFIRKTRIDELPQLLNILRGDMGIIGPRPERPIFTEKFSEEIPNFRDRLVIRPGLTGWAQVNGGYDITPREKFELDMYYIKNMSVLLDMKILVKTIKVVITGEGAR